MTSTATGAAVGVVAGSLWDVLRLPSVEVRAAGLLFLLALAADLGRVPVLATRRQVPQEWGRLLPPVTVGVLYGGRLGVGPLTILNSWFWWAGLLLGAGHGPWIALAVGALFGGVRACVTALAGYRRALVRPAQ